MLGEVPRGCCVGGGEPWVSARAQGEEPLDQPTSGPCISLPRKDREVSLVARLVPCWTGATDVWPPSRLQASAFLLSSLSVSLSLPLLMKPMRTGEASSSMLVATGAV